MARNFTIPQYLVRTTNIPSLGSGITMAISANIDVQRWGTLFGIGRAGFSDPVILIGSNPAGDAYFAISDNAGNGNNPFSLGALSTGVWSRILAYATADSATIIADGGTPVTDSSGTVGAQTVGRLTVGVNAADLAGGSDGKLAEAAVWPRVLAQEEIDTYFAGYSPLSIPGLQTYVPIFGRASPEQDWASGASMTVSGATISPHPRVIYPGTARVVPPAPSAPSAFNPAWFQQSTVQHA